MTDADVLTRLLHAVNGSCPPTVTSAPHVVARVAGAAIVELS